MKLHCKPISNKRERTRQAIIDAAMIVIANKGLAASSIDELMKQTSMARGTFYNYFQSRDELLLAVIKQTREHLHLRIENLIAEDLSAQQKVAYMMYGMVRYSVERPCFGWMLVKIGGDAGFFNPIDMQDQHFHRTNTALMQLVKHNIHFLTAQIYMTGAINNLIRHLLQKNINIEQAEQLMALSLQGVGAKHTEIDTLIEQARAFAETVHQRYELGNCCTDDQDVNGR